jgi:hypothetical protein
MKKFFLSMLSIAMATSILYMTSCCKDKSDQLGYIEGTVSDFETGQAIPNVTVDIVSNGNTTFIKQIYATGNDGKFGFNAIEAGNYRLTFTKNGYDNNHKDVHLLPNYTVSCDVSLIPVKPVLSVSRTMLDFGKTTNTLPIEIRNTGKGELLWEIVEDMDWLEAIPPSGTVTGEPASVTITVNRSLITSAVQTGAFTVSSTNGGSAIVNIKVSR